MSQHTSGPWILSGGANGEWQITASDVMDPKGEDWCIAMTFGSVGHEGGNGESDANAQLIAAAPNLLELAAEAMWRRDYPNGGSVYKSYDSLGRDDKQLHRKEALAAAMSQSPAQPASPPAQENDRG